MILETNMLGYIYTFFFILFQQSLHTTSLERSLFFMYYLLDERQLKAFISNKHVFNLQRFERERVYSGNELFNKLCTSLPSIFMTGVHPPSPHPKFPMWQKTDNGWESTRRVTTPLILVLLQKAWGLQLWIPSAHSSMSEDKKRNSKRRNKQIN